MNRANGEVVFERSPIPYNKAGINNTMAHVQLAKNQICLPADRSLRWSDIS